MILLVFTTACNSSVPQQPSAGIAYVGPATLNIRKELASRSAPVATVKQGDRLDVLEIRRRFVRVRTVQGIEGWTDSNMLLTEQQMEDLRKLAASTSKLPSQGRATAFDLLNIHTSPARQSTSFFQIPEGGSVEVIGHRLAPRNSPPEAIPLPAPMKRTTPTKPKGKNAKSRSSAPPPPVPAGPPKNWQNLSRPHVTDLPGYVSPAAAPVQLEDWSLVRTKDGRVGWVLARMLSMAVPDEVAQYAEGHRITSYVSLGAVKDRDGKARDNWLWTTVGSGEHPYEFDSFRVFVWSLKHNRYETAYIERNVEGFYPIEAQPMEGKDEKAFSVVLREKDDKLYKRTYAFTGFRVRMVSKEPYTPPPDLPEVRASRSFDPPPAQPPSETGIGDKLKSLREKWFKR